MHLKIALILFEERIAGSPGQISLRVGRTLIVSLGLKNAGLMYRLWEVIASVVDCRSVLPRYAAKMARVSRLMPKKKVALERAYPVCLAMASPSRQISDHSCGERKLLLSDITGKSCFRWSPP